MLSVAEPKKTIQPIGQALLLFLLLAAFTITACKKKSDPDNYYTLPKDGLQYIQLRQGQYFIYKDSATGTLDSVIVTESKLAEKQYHTGSGQLPYSVYTDDYYLTLTKTTATGSSSVWLKGAASANFSSTNFSMLSQQTGMDWDARMFRYPVSALAGIFPNDRDNLSLTVEGRSYTQVILTAGNYATDSRFYWAKGVGLIRYEKGGPNRQTFTLLRNN